MFENIKWFKKKPRLAKHPDFSKMEYKFTDSQGRRYYSYLNDYDIPIKRYGQFKRFLMELANGMSRDEVKLFISAMKSSLNKTPVDIAQIGFVLNEMELRNDILFHEEIMFNMVATLYIREDQHPGEWDEETEQVKAQYLKIEAQGKLYDFFVTASLGKYIPYLREHKGTLREFLIQTNKKRKAMLIVMKENFGLDRKSLETLESKMMSL